MITRRGVLASGAALAAAPALGRRLPDTVVVGAGVFGAWTARRLQQAGQRVLLVDAFGPAHARASSGGESRLTRAGYGEDAVYTSMAWASLPEWKALSARAGLPIFHPAGVLFMFAREEANFTDSLRVHRELRLPIEALDAAAMRRRWPQIDFDGLALGLLEPGFGALMARRAVQTLVAEFVAAGGEYRQAAIRPPGATARLQALTATSGDTLAAGRFVFAAGPWLPRLLPDVLDGRIFPTRQEVFFFSPPAGDARFGPAALPGWAEYSTGDFFYGFPDLEARGFKIANDAHGVAVDPDTQDRQPSAAALAAARGYVDRRFPALKGAPLAEARVCQYENSANGDLLIDRHPAWRNAVLVGAGSGHGFKHGPEVGRLAAALLLGDAAPEPRFSLASKSTRQARAVH